MSLHKQELNDLILRCQKYGSYYTAQTILGLIEEILQKSRNMGHTIAFLQIKNKICNTNLKEASLKDVYNDIFDAIKKRNMQDPEILQFKKYIKMLEKKNIY